MTYDEHERYDKRQGSSRIPATGLPDRVNGVSRHLQQPVGSGGVDACWFPVCTLIAQPSEWSEELNKLGVRVYKRPEGLYKALRAREVAPEVCIVDLDSVPRNLVKAIDIRIPCPKIWVGKSAPNPVDIKNFGIYYSRARPEELNNVANRLARTDRCVVLPAAMAGKQLLPMLATNTAFKERLSHYTDLFANANLITIHGDDPLELQLVAQYLAVETQRARIWEVRSEASFQSLLRKIAQARRPGTDVTIVVSPDVDTGLVREFSKSIPMEYALIKLAARAHNPVDELSFTLPRPSERPDDIESWVTWFLCRATIEYGIALSGQDDLVASVRRALDDNPGIEEIQTACERSVRQHATMMLEQSEFLSYDDLVHNFERTILRQALCRNDWNFSATAKSLGLPESSLRYKLNKLGIARSDDSPSGL